MNTLPSVDDATSDDAPLDEKRLALYRARLKSGYYRSADVVKHVAQRMTDDLFPPVD